MHGVRFDDRFSTVLGAEAPVGPAAVAQWRQLVDLVAQQPGDADPALSASALVRAHSLRDHVSEQVRSTAIRSLGGRLRSPALVRYLAHDVPSVAAAAMAGARLSDEEWRDAIADLPTRARGFLRNRGDLGPLARAALDAYGAADFRLGDDSGATRDESPAETAVADAEPARGGVAIRDLVERIERLRAARDAGEAPQLPLEGGTANEGLRPVERFTFETDEHGVLAWVDGAPRGGVVGIDIARPAFDDGPGPDAHAAAAFRQRMPIDHARMRLLGGPAMAGDWRIEAMPFFDEPSGRFLGYRGVMRRPVAGEDARLTAAVAEGQERADSMRQLVHELRTPLGAIIGFAEIIEQQLFGPAAFEYRSLAGSILEDARRLLAGFDDLDTAAQLDSGRFALDDGQTDPAWLTARLAERLQTLTDARHVSLNLVAVEPMRSFAVPSETSERIFARLISAIVLGCAEGEQLSGTLRTRVGATPVNQFLLSRPARLAGLGEDELLHNDVVAGEGDAASPLLGLGFSLRLVRNIARAAGGDLRFHAAGLLLTLPAAGDTQASGRG